MDDLRALRSTDPVERERALARLYEQRPAESVPFVLELLADRKAPGRAELLRLLSGLAVGSDELVLPHGVSARDAVYDAVAAGLALYRDLLLDGDDEVEREAARLLAWFPGSTAALQARLTTAEPVLALTLLAALGLTGDERLIPTLAGYLRPEQGGDALGAAGATGGATGATDGASAADTTGATGGASAADTTGATGGTSATGGADAAGATGGSGPETAWRVGSALALARLAGPAAPAGTLEILLRATRGDAPDVGIPFLHGDLAAYAAESLRLLGPETRPAAVDAVAYALARSDALHGVALVHALLPLAFPRGVERDTPFDALAPEQQQALHGLVTAPWFATGTGYANVALMLSDRGLPTDAPELHDYLRGRPARGFFRRVRSRRN